MDLNKLRLFYHVASVGSFTKASGHVGINSTVLSRHIHDLEEDLGCPLFVRHFRGVHLTQNGQKLYKAAETILNELRTTEEILRHQSGEEKNNLTVLATKGLTTDWVVDCIPDFVKLHPSVQIQISSQLEFPEHPQQSFDVFIGHVSKKEKGFIYKPVKDFYFRLYASRQYLNKCGIPQSLDDLKEHQLIGFAINKFCSLAYNQKKQKGKKYSIPKPFICIDSTLGEFKLVEAGLGIASLCNEESFLKGSDLVPVLPHLDPVKIEVSFVYPEEFDDIQLIHSFYDIVSGNSQQSHPTSQDDLLQKTAV